MEAAAGWARADPYGEIAYYFGKSEPTEAFYMDRFCLDAACPGRIPVQIGTWPAIGATFYRNYLTTFDFSAGKLSLTPYGEG